MPSQPRRASCVRPGPGAEDGEALLMVGKRETNPGGSSNPLRADVLRMLGVLKVATADQIQRPALLHLTYWHTDKPTEAAPRSCHCRARQILVRSIRPDQRAASDTVNWQGGRKAGCPLAAALGRAGDEPRTEAVRAAALPPWQGSGAVKRSLYGISVPLRLHIDLERVSPAACRESPRIQAPVRE